MQLPSLALLLAAIFAPGVPAAQHPEAVVRYQGESVPNWLAFRSFVESFEEDSERMNWLVVAALDLPKNRSSLDHAAERAALFREVLLKLENESDAATQSLLCSSDPYRRSVDHALDLMDAGLAVRQAVAEKYRVSTLALLPPRERKALNAYLRDSKKGISYASHSSRGLELEDDPRTVLVQFCADEGASR